MTLAGQIELNFLCQVMGWKYGEIELKVEHRPGV